MATVLPKHLRKYISSDYAVTDAEDGQDPDYTVHVVIGLDPGDRAYIVDGWRGQKTADVWIQALFDLVKKHKPSCVLGEAGVIERSVRPLLDRMMREQRVFFRREWVASTRDKAARARSLQAWASSGRVLFPRTEFADTCIEEMVGFLSGAKHDDCVDALSLFFLAIDTAHKAIVPSETTSPEPNKWTRKTKLTAKSWRTV